MAITNNIDLITSYDADSLVTMTRVLSATAPPAKEHAAQVLVCETLRDILAEGITLEEWNGMDPAMWDTWWASRRDRARERAKLNVAAHQVPHLTSGEVDQCLGVSSTLFENGYTAVMAGISQENKVTFTRLGGV